mgnify:CR=1 FL=1
MKEVEVLSEKIKELMEAMVEREDLLEEAGRILKELKKLFQNVAREAWRGGASRETVHLDGGDILMTIEIPGSAVYLSFSVKPRDCDKEPEIYSEMRRLAKGFRYPEDDGMPLAILHYFVRRGAAELVKSIDKKIREEKELTEEVRRVLSEVKEALAPVVLAAKT